MFLDNDSLIFMTCSKVTKLFLRLQRSPFPNLVWMALQSQAAECFFNLLADAKGATKSC